METPMRRVSARQRVLDCVEKQWKACGRHDKIARLRTMTLCNAAMGGHRGSARLWELKGEGLVQYATDSIPGSTQLLYTIIPGPTHPLSGGQRNLAL